MDKLVYPNRKKLQKAKEVYQVYYKNGSMQETGKILGICARTVGRYIATYEDLIDKKKLKDKDKYYSKDIKDIPPVYINTNFTPDIDGCQVPDKNISNNLVLDEELSTEIVEVVEDGIIANKVPDIKDTKNRILAEKLDTIAFKYLEYLDNPSEQQLHRTSLKDRAVIAGILLDKKSQLVSKAADSIKNQSIIFNLFGDNKNLAEFITGNMKRQKALQDRPVKQYKEA